VPVGLLAGMVSELLGTRLPGRGTNWLKQKYRFVEVARVGEPLTARVEISRVRPDKALVNLSSTCTTSDGRVIFHGESLVLVKELE
jgi:acyl dehydratase